MKDKYYTFAQRDNVFEITNNLQNEDDLLQVECINLRDNSIVKLQIELGGLF